MATPESLVKYASAESANTILSSGCLRWRSPELLDEPWAIKHDPRLGFDHLQVNEAMLKMAVSMIFMRDLPSGNTDHPLYKAIRRWRSEDRFHDETEAFEALSELLAPTPETLEGKLRNIVTQWQDYVTNARVTCFSENYRNIDCWRRYADNHRGLALQFEPNSSFSEPKQVEYSSFRCHLTTIKEQVNDLVGIKRANVAAEFESKLLIKHKADAFEKEWRCIKLLAEEELDCGEDVEDWYLDEPFQVNDLKTVYFGFMMPEKVRSHFYKLIRTSYPETSLKMAVPNADNFDLEFERLHC